MPSKYVVRNFTKNSFYHVFNCGVEKRNIFIDEEDYITFLDYLFIYTQPLEKVLERHLELPMRLIDKNMSEELEILAYCLMPNHFHLFIKQKDKNGVSKLLKQLTNAYTFYFNNKYERIGSLMQGRFKAVSVNEDNLFIHLVRYIHLNPIESSVAGNLDSFRWSSYGDYLGKESELPSSKNKILSYFPSVGAFRGFHEDPTDYKKNCENIRDIAIDLL